MKPILKMLQICTQVLLFKKMTIDNHMLIKNGYCIIQSLKDVIVLLVMKYIAAFVYLYNNLNKNKHEER